MMKRKLENDEPGRIRNGQRWSIKKSRGKAYDSLRQKA